MTTRTQCALRHARWQALRRRTGPCMLPRSGRRWSWRRPRWRRAGRRPGFRPAPAPPRTAAGWRCRLEPVARREAVSEVHAGCSRRDEPGGLHPDVAASRQARPHHGDDRAGRVHGVDPAAGLIRSDQVAAEAAEPRRRHDHPALHGRRASGDGGHPAIAADAEHRGPPARPGRHEQPVPEPASGIERDPGQGAARWQAGEPPRLPLPADHDDTRSRARLDGEGRIVPERAAGPPDLTPAGEHQVRLGARRGQVAARAAGKRAQRAVASQDQQPPGRGYQERPVTARPGQIHHARQVPEHHPGGRRRRADPPGAAPATGYRDRGDTQREIPQPDHGHPIYPGPRRRFGVLPGAVRAPAIRGP